MDEPTLFGKIAANSLSDVYAMGGPLSSHEYRASCTIGERGVLANVMKNGAGDVCVKLVLLSWGGIVLKNEVPLFGLSVTGTVNPKGVWKNVGAQIWRCAGFDEAYRHRYYEHSHEGDGQRP